VILAKAVGADVPLTPGLASTELSHLGKKEKQSFNMGALIRIFWLINNHWKQYWQMLIMLGAGMSAFQSVQS